MTQILLKKQLFILLICLFCFSTIVGCGSNSPSEDQPDTSPGNQPSASPGTLTFSDSFDKLDLTKWTKSNDTNPQPSYAITIASNSNRLSNHAVRFELHNTDPTQSGGKRSEIRILPPDLQLVERWFAFSIYLPSDESEDYMDDQNSAEILAQWHNYPDLELGEGWTSPPLALVTLAGHWRLNGLWDANQISNMDDIYKNHQYYDQDLGSYKSDKGKWIDWVFHVRWGWLDSQNPITEVYKNGELIFTRNGPNTTNDKSGTYFNIGIYKWDWEKNPEKSALKYRVVYHDEVRIGGADCKLSDFYPVH